MRVAAAIVVALVAFALYFSTLLPGVDFGDTASFQIMGGEPVITPRDGYPLYYAAARLLVPFFENRAYAMNLLSAIQAAIACGVIVLLAFELSGSLLAAVATALLFAGSYTFWSQAIIAEVYALHILLVALTLLLLHRWGRHCTHRRLAAFLAVYALAFGNHLSTILLLPAYGVFVLISARGGWRSALRLQIVLVAAAFAALGAAQYYWNYSALWLGNSPPDGFVDAMRTFWFDVTKSDWRETMVLEVPAVAASERARMYWFDLRQQFGPIPPLVALAGLIHLARTDWRLALLLALIFGSTMTFALGYNVGDAHVFFLASHLMVALLAAAGTASFQKVLRGRARELMAVVLLGIGSWNIYRNYPALDRSTDRRPADVLTSLTEGLTDENAVLITDLNWQIQNGLTYFGQHVQPELLQAHLVDVFLYAPVLIRDNLAAGRRVFVNEQAARKLAAAYGPVFRIEPEGRSQRGLAEAVNDLPAGSRYVLCVLGPTPEFPLDRDALAKTVRALTGGADVPVPNADYFVVAGQAGAPPTLIRHSDRPFREHVTLDGLPVEVRMESWLAFDTIRRMGFGHVVANRRHSLILERGVSFVALEADGHPRETAYAAGVFAPQPRYLVLSSK
jgi:hypothetical protein